MTRPVLLLVAVALLGSAAWAQRAAAPTATDRYHEAAQAYVAGETAAGIRAAEAGLALAPDNVRLRALLDLLRQDEPPQDDGDGEQDERADSGDDGDDESESQDDERSPPENRPDASQDEAERDQTQTDPSGGGQGEQERQNDAPSQPGQSAPSQPGDEPLGAAGQQTRMSAAQAERLLDAVGAEEQLMVQGQRRPSRMRRSEKDW